MNTEIQEGGKRNNYEENAKKAYLNDTDEKRNKAIAAGKAIDNALKLEYSKGGISKSHFMMSNYLKYFSYEALGIDRVKLLWYQKNKTI